jgi:hypothetical protein
MSYLGGTVRGKRSEAGFQSTMVGSDVAMKRKILRKAFKSNQIKTNTGDSVGKSTIGPFRTAFHMGDVLSRKYQSCGGANQVNGTHVTRINLGGSVPNDSCNVETHTVTHSVTPQQVSLGSGNGKTVADSSLYTRFKNLESVNLNYNDSTFGGSDSNTVYTALNSVRK